ncbi:MULTISPECIES: LacI family DNA-binding transcriptional regulator [Nonomuraea]|uniref:LacI family DNA-binding transcriptional regulator n=2 Tax=Nonomuraea TaxID=83681 RepID=A0ABW1C279_9ACTN|nr:MULTISPECIES: LacI family DNA-binding transcriptional regulator [Nonomuraea]MDA0643178.1 LacI family DNA-binding transcriptional regulator [Nonomuraea ferruginea]
MTTIYDVARHAGVSAATVSRVVNGRSSVDPALAERVRQAMGELKYRPNAVARNLRRSQTTLWAVIISDIGNPFFTAMVRGVEDVAQKAGFSVVLCNSDEDPAKEGKYVTAALNDQMAGVIISPSGRGTHVNRLVEAGVPVVVIDRLPRGVAVDTVMVDNEHGAQLATGHLIEAGYERIACVTGPRRLSTAAQRLRGYQRALRAAGRKVRTELIRFADFREEGGYAAMADLLRQDPRPDAVFAANNLMTVGAVECLVDQGVRIPQEVGVAGFDNIPWAHLVRPTLTTVDQPTYELGRTAALLLAERITEPTRPASSVTLHTQLHVRESSRR